MRFLMVLVFLLTAGCAARECTLEGVYLEAEELGPLVNPDNGELPPLDPSFAIPPIADTTIVAEREFLGPEGEVIKDCLDRPPRLPAADGA